MATPTRPCPYCGAAVLMNAPACGTCGRPMPPMQAGAPPGGPAPAKTMFGYAAPQIPQAQRPGAAPAPAQPAYGQPQGAPPAYGQPQGGQPGFGQPQQPPGFGQPQPPAYGQPPQQQQPYGQPQQPGGFGQPQAPAYGQPPQQPAYGQPQQPAYGQPQPPAYGQPRQPGYGQPQQGFGGPQSGYSLAPNPFAPPQQDMPGPLDNMARHIPSSAPGTIFGIPVARHRDPGFLC